VNPARGAAALPPAERERERDGLEAEGTNEGTPLPGTPPQKQQTTNNIQKRKNGRSVFAPVARDAGANPAPLAAVVVGDLDVAAAGGLGGAIPKKPAERERGGGECQKCSGEDIVD
jgi:hypothetical protein